MFLVILVTLLGMFAIVLAISLQDSSDSCNALIYANRSSTSSWYPFDLWLQRRSVCQYPPHDFGVSIRYPCIPSEI